MPSGLRPESARKKQSPSEFQTKLEKYVLFRSQQLVKGKKCCSRKKAVLIHPFLTALLLQQRDLPWPRLVQSSATRKLLQQPPRPSLVQSSSSQRSVATARSVAGSVAERPVAVRVVDHASASSTSAVFGLASLHKRANLNYNQPTNARGYSAADAVARKRDAALTEADGLQKSDGWLTAVLPECASLAAVQRGEAALRRRDVAARVLHVADVNALVEHHSHLEATLQAQEEWWAGAVSLDNVLDGGFTEFLDSLVSGHQAQHQHRWRAWVVNTEWAWQEGRHWFTAVAGSRVSVAGPFALLLQSSPIRRMTFLQSSHTILTIFCMRNFCRAGMATALKRACAEWNAALVDGTHASRQRRRKPRHPGQAETPTKMQKQQ